MNPWEMPQPSERLLNGLLRLSKNVGATYSKGKDTHAAVEVVKEQLLVRAEVKAVVYKPVPYSGHKTGLSQVDSAYRQPFGNATTLGGGYKQERKGNAFDSVYTIRDRKSTRLNSSHRP